MKPLVIAFLALCAACQNDDGWPSATQDAEIAVRVEVLDTEAAQVGVRVWNEEHELLRDDLVDVADFPRILRFFPRQEVARAAPYRHVLIELELWGEDGCPRGHVDRFIRYQPGSQERVELSLSASDVSACSTYYIDAEVGEDGPCVEAAPCPTVQHALFLANDDGISSVIFVAGGQRYDAGRWTQFDGIRAPITIRAWPGRTLVAPQFEGSVGAENGTIFSTVFDDLTLDGLEVLGGAPQGIVLHRTTRGAVRHCRVFSSGDEAGIEATFSTGIRLFHNFVEGGGGAGIRTRGIPSGHDGDDDAMLDPQVEISANLVRNNGGAGILIGDVNARIIARGNTLCANAGAGIEIADPIEEPALHFTNNAIFDNASGVDSEDFGGVVRFERNTFSTNSGGSIDAAIGNVDLIMEGNILFGGGAARFAADNHLDDESAVDRSDCFLRPGPQGVCASFPDCP